MIYSSLFVIFHSLWIDGSLDKEVTVKYGNSILSQNQIVVLENV